MGIYPVDYIYVLFIKTFVSFYDDYQAIYFDLQN